MAEKVDARARMGDIVKHIKDKGLEKSTSDNTCYVKLDINKSGKKRHLKKGRPFLPDDKRMDKIIILRLTEKEFIALDALAAAAGLKRAKYIRRRIFGDVQG